MTMYVLGSDFQASSRAFLRAGKTISDAVYDVPTMRSQGAILYPASPAISARAAQVVALQKRGQFRDFDQTIDRVGPFALLPRPRALPAGRRR